MVMAGAIDPPAGVVHAPLPLRNLLVSPLGSSWIAPCALVDAAGSQPLASVPPAPALQSVPTPWSAEYDALGFDVDVDHHDHHPSPNRIQSH